MQSRIRLCNNPPPAFDGPQCEGSDTQIQVCKERLCPGTFLNDAEGACRCLLHHCLNAPHALPTVDGKWSSWVSWGACSVSCGGGTRQRTRLCASPAPQHGGRQCEGSDVHIDFCNSDPCPSESDSILLNEQGGQTILPIFPSACKILLFLYKSDYSSQSVVTGDHGVPGAAVVRRVMEVR